MWWMGFCRRCDEPTAEAIRQDGLREYVLCRQCTWFEMIYASHIRKRAIKHEREWSMEPWAPLRHGRVLFTFNPIVYPKATQTEEISTVGSFNEHCALQAGLSSPSGSRTLPSVQHASTQCGLQPDLPSPLGSRISSTQTETTSLLRGPSVHEGTQTLLRGPSVDEGTQTPLTTVHIDGWLNIHKPHATRQVGDWLCPTCHGFNEYWMQDCERGCGTMIWDFSVLFLTSVSPLHWNWIPLACGDADPHSASSQACG